jgi:hypothetical protein
MRDLETLEMIKKRGEASNEGGKGGAFDRNGEEQRSSWY